MKKILVMYADYNVWANQRIVDCVNNLSDEQIHQSINSSFPSIYKTLAHMWDVEFIWWQRVKLIEAIDWPSTEFSGSILELGNKLLHQSKQWKEWIDLATEAALEHEFIYKNTKKDQFKQPVYQALHHLFNHQTHHRGQISVMLRQVGLDRIPNTDLIAFSRKK